MIGHAKISKQMRQMTTYCKLVSLRLDDMQDMVLITDHKLVQRTSEFDCRQLYQGLRQMLELKASLKNVDLQFEGFFVRQEKLVMVTMLENMQKWLVQSDLSFLNFSNHPLFMYISQPERFICLPQQLIGDHNRLEQCIVNMVQNAIQNSRNNGKVKVLMAFDK